MVVFSRIICYQPLYLRFNFMDDKLPRKSENYIPRKFVHNLYGMWIYL